MRRSLALLLGLVLLVVGCQMTGNAAASLASFQSGVKALDQGDPDRAIDLFSQSIAGGGLNDQTKAQAFYNRGIARTRLGQLYEAVADFDQAIALNANFTAAYNNRGMVFNRLSQFGKAKEDLDMAIRLDPELASAYYNRSFTLAAMDKAPQAIQDLETALKLDSGNEVYRNRLNFLRRPEQRLPQAPLPQGKITGTGFVVSSQGHVLTNLHVVKDARVIHMSGQEEPLAVLAIDAMSDLALLKMPKASDGDRVATFPEAKNLRQGENVVVVGFPLHGLLASGPNVSTGALSALAGPGNNPTLLQISAPVQPGNSGGPLLDQSGNVIGVVVGKLDPEKVAKLFGQAPQNVNFAISGSVARSFLERNGVVVRTAPDGHDLPSADIVQKASGYVMLLECLR